MVCIYCGNDTQVINSRPQKRVNCIWRRRKCVSCGSIFSTQEQVDLSATWRIKNSSGQLVSFSKNTLLLSLYKSLEHREQPLADAEALLNTVISKLLQTPHNGLIERHLLITTVTEVLTRFDTPASVSYAAFHPVK